MVKAESYGVGSDIIVCASTSEQIVLGAVVLRVCILPHLRHSGDSLAASPTSKPDLTPYSGVLMVKIYFGDTWETWDTYFQ